jgi:hypothetical protein
MYKLSFDFKRDWDHSEMGIDSDKQGVWNHSATVMTSMTEVSKRAFVWGLNLI